MFNLCIFVKFPVFLQLLISSFILFWLDKLLCMMISRFLNILRLFCDLIFDVYCRRLHIHLRRMCILLLLSVLNIFAMFSWFIVFFKSSISFLIFCSSSTIKNYVVTSPIVIVILSISPFMYSGFLCLVCMCIIVISSWSITLLSL